MPYIRAYIYTHVIAALSLTIGGQGSDNKETEARPRRNLSGGEIKIRTIPIKE